MAIAITLTSDELDFIRLQLGDVCLKLTDAMIQQAYNAAGGDECGTNALLARWNWMAASTSVLQLNSGQQVISTTRIDVYKKRLDYWENCAGTGMGTISVGVIELGVDVTSDDLENPDASWLWG